MSLSEIEEKAEQLAGYLFETDSKSAALLYQLQLEGLKDLAIIKNIAMESIPAAQAGPCLSLAPKVAYAGSAPVHCTLFSGHAGRHTDGEAVWSVGVEALCGQRWTWADAEGKHSEICTVVAGHNGLHFNGVTGVNSLHDVEPTPQYCGAEYELGPNAHTSCLLKPGHVEKYQDPHTDGSHSWRDPMDGTGRLHDLARDLVRQSSTLFEASNKASDDGADITATKHLASSKAYDDAATRLATILLETGL